jgi:hypothetical protein
VQRLEREMVKLKGKTLGQPTQDNHDYMVNKLELGTTVTRLISQQKYKSPHHKKQEKVKNDLKHIKCFKCSDMGHYAIMCSAQVESKTRPSRRQRRQLRTITCFGCKKEGHRILTCPILQVNHTAQAEPVRPVCITGQASPSVVWLPKKIWRQILRGLLHQEQDKVF